MTTGDSPAIARRRVRLALREAREAAKLTQQHVADEMDWSLSKIIRIESGEVSIAPNDLRPLLVYLGITNRAQILELLQDAKTARTRQRQAWWQGTEYRDLLTDPMRHLIEYEAEAVAIRYYSIYFMPGPLQIPEYAAALMDSWDTELPAELIDKRLKARRVRRDALRARLGTFTLDILLDESVMMRPIGGESVFATQLRELHQLAIDGYAQIRMISFLRSAPITNNASFDLLSLGADDRTGDVLYRETGMGDELVEDKATTSRHHDRYNRLWDVALAESDTIDFIHQRIENLERNILAEG